MWTLFDKQKDALKLCEDNKFSLLIGQGRASKTTFAVYYCIRRALLYPNTSHIIFRMTHGSVIDGIFKQTLPQVLENFFPYVSNSWSINKTDSSITFPNGSRLILRGLDTEDRCTKILSQQFATVIFDEVQTLPFIYFSILLTRLPQPVNVNYSVKIICTANWCSTISWPKYFFADKIHPTTKQSLNDSIGMLTFTSDDNKSIDAANYIKTISELGDKKAALMCAGEGFFDPPGAAPLWLINDIQHIDVIDIKKYDDIVCAYDPAVSNTRSSDGHGLCIAGKIGEAYHIIECYERVEDPDLFVQEVIKKYHQYNCSTLVYENNQGGSFIESLINAHDKSVHCQSVRATQGKVLRAESIVALYKQKLVYHCDNFEDVTTQMLSYIGVGKSPNSLDALVYSLKYLSESVSYVDPNAI